MQRDEIGRWMFRALIAWSLLSLTAGAGAGMRARLDLSDPARETVPSASAAAPVFAATMAAPPIQTQSEAPRQPSTGQKAGPIVCPVTEATNPPLSAALFTARALYRSGKFDQAIRAYNTLIPGGGSEAASAYAGLARVYLKQHEVAKADDAAMKAVALTPDRAPAMVALGEVYYRQGKLAEAEELFYRPLRNCNLDARAFLGLTHIYWATLNFKRAKDDIDQAYKMDPEDPDIRRTYMQTLSGAERVQFLKGYLAGATNDDAQSRENFEQELAMMENENHAEDHKCRMVTNVTKTETRLEPLLYGPQSIRGYGLMVKLNGVSSRLMLDTGASGILVDSKIAAKAGIKPIVDEKIQGIGDKGAAPGFVGYAEKIQIGELEFQGCLVEVATGRSMLGDDGLIGADVFRHFLVDVDMPNGKFKVSPLPPIPDEPVATTSLDTKSVGVRRFRDRYVPKEMQDYTKIFLIGHDMLIPTRVNDAAAKLFLIDTGSFDDTLSPAAAKEVTKLSRDENTQVKGLNGTVKEVYRASEAKLQFSHFYQKRQGLVTFDLTGISNADGTEVSGVLGFAMLCLLDMKIDYRDGLVDFTYGGERFH
jgi:tetratricopeptide (TPR) repeat protein